MSSSYVYTGPWINYSHGTYSGATITLTTRDAAFLLALLAIIVTTAGHSFWTITSFIIHQTRCNPSPHDAIYHQEQAILKNSDSALTAAWAFSRLIFSWRKHAKAKKSHSLSFIALSLLLAALFGIASIFSSQVTKAAGTEVLLSSANCGTWSFNVTSTLAGFYQEDLKNLNETITAANYASNCYNTGTNNTSTPQCNSYITPSIPWTENQNTSCPFANGTCLISSTAAYQMDTGPMDSNLVLGLNAPTSERVIARKVATCAPVHIAPYAETGTITFPDGNTDTFAVLLLGDPGTGGNFTYAYDEHNQFTGLGYDLQSIATTGGSSDNWTPIQEFNRSDADVSMYFLAPNNVTYVYPTSDPIFSATTPLNSSTIIDNTTVPIWGSDHLVTAIGCIDQYQICSPSPNSLCTPLTSIYDLYTASESLSLNLYQYATILTLTTGLSKSSIFNSVTGRGESALSASNTVFGGARAQLAQLPDNQWQIEVSNWFSVGLATFQAFLVEKATGPKNVVENGGVITFPVNEWEKAVCEMQMVRNVAGYQNFSVVGVSVILVVGSLIVVCGWVVDWVTGLVQKRWKRGKYQRLSWVSDGYLQLQRLGWEGVGLEEWRGCDDVVPVARDLEAVVTVVPGLDIEDGEHPCFLKPTVVTDVSVGINK